MADARETKKEQMNERKKEQKERKTERSKKQQSRISGACGLVFVGDHQTILI